jgi:hypothetical protein
MTMLSSGRTMYRCISHQHGPLSFFQIDTRQCFMHYHEPPRRNCDWGEMDCCKRERVVQQEIGELISCNEAAMRCSTPRQRGQSDIINLARIKEATEVSALWIIYKALRPRHQPWCVWRGPRRADRRNREGFRELKKLQYSVQEVAGKVWPTATICRRCTHLLKQQSNNLGRPETATI